MHGRGHDAYKGHSRVGYAFIHSAVDDRSRLAYSEVLPDERQATHVAFWHRARAWFADHSVTITEVPTDNGNPYRNNHHRSHTALGGLAPIDRVNNVTGQYI